MNKNNCQLVMPNMCETNAGYIAGTYLLLGLRSQ